MKQTISITMCGLGIIFSAAACSSSPTGNNDEASLQKRIDTAYQELVVKCNFGSTAQGKQAGALFSGVFAGYGTLPGVPAGLLAKAADCIEAQAKSCADFSEVPACKGLDDAKGTLKTGDACMADVQCATGVCKGGELELETAGIELTCGSCVVPVAEGGNCSDNPCASGLTCSYTNDVGTCVKKTVPVAIGGECDAALRCVDNAYCKLDGAKGTCTANPKAGEACGTNGASSCQTGAFCSFSTKKCEPLPARGASCKEAGRCMGGAACVDDVCVDGAATVGLGASCAGNRVCGEGLACVKTSGTARACATAKKLGETCDNAGNFCDRGLFCGASKKCFDVTKSLSCPLP